MDHLYKHSSIYLDGCSVFVDPNLDCPETEKRNPIEVMKTMMEFHSQQFTPRWLGVMGDEHIPR